MTRPVSLVGRRRHAGAPLPASRFFTCPAGLILRALPLVGILAAPAIAAVETATSEVSPIVVTATRTAETADETLVSVTVVTRKEIEQQQSLSTLDILRGLPGVALSNAGGAGKSSSLYLRGANSDQVLFLVDGFRVGSATTGQTAFQNIPVAQIERLEIVRGPHSSLYGSDAIGGVVQIFTRRGGGPLRPFFNTTAGTYGTAGIAGGLSGGGEHGRFSLSGNVERTQGFNGCRGRGAPYYDGCFTDEPDDDGYSNKGVSANVGYDLGDRAKVDLIFLRAETDVEFDGSWVNESRGLLQVLGATVRLRPLENWEMLLRAGRSWDEDSSYKDGAYVGRFDTRRDSLSWQNDVAVGENSLVTLGIDYTEDRITSNDAYSVTSRDNTGLFGQYQGWFGPLRLTASLRHDDNEQFGGHNTGDIALGYDVGPALRLMASYGTAFTAPNFNDLYYVSPSPFFADGNPDLQPEQSRSLEVGASGLFDTWRWSLNLFQTEVDDLIVLQPPLYFAENIDRARIRGLEGTLTGQLLGVDIGVNLTLLDPRNESDGPNDGNLLQRRPEQTFRLDLDRTFGRFSAGTGVVVSGRSFDDAANTVRLDGYTLVDLRAEYAFSDALRLQARLDNLFDEDYETAAWYNQPGRGLYVTLRYAP
ncbi:TonB-dependent vitamin B12 receptor [Thiohalocapsa marina]|uniref:TonB-dependent vitamin B12 receptor n=1 Tax=Thiohalocapsa marina TaxID=424902 RepID=A0A5M8FL53_9GAMM|nr:TonB-dependent vitamin B12 receptor [Thiohalocapsa marina]KAA6185643.1 TonB-dependent vitamin B12 receptor [Thiohalocapsa marina]